MLTESQRAKMAEYTAAVSADTAAKKRLAALFDDGIYTEIDAYAKCGEDLTGVAAAYGFVNGAPVYAFS
ncbi:MAG: carboxyl transferase, partial [Oscillospiraceae bacterium]